MDGACSSSSSLKRRQTSEVRLESTPTNKSSTHGSLQRTKTALLDEPISYAVDLAAVSDRRAAHTLASPAKVLVGSLLAPFNTLALTLRP